jgi:hypothetical protein
VLPRRIRVTIELAPGQLPIYIDPVGLEQVIVNLALNAAEAMPAGGRLHFRTGRHKQLPASSNLHGKCPPAPVIFLAVEDTGIGIPTRFLGSVFNPFVTTKPVGKGSGLGLYHARLFVEKHNSAISVETQEGEGSTFQLWFGEADFSEGQSAARADKFKRHTLLVVGGPGDSLQQMVTLLRANGYYVVPSDSVAAALEALYSPFFQFTGFILLAMGGNTEAVSLCERVRAHKLPIKTLLICENRTRDELEDKLARIVDVVVPANTSPEELLARLDSTLSL